MNKQKYGFTLIELLAVIVILAIILVIAIPTITKTTNKAKKESFYLYAQNIQSKAIEKYTQDLEYNPENTPCVVYDISSDLGLSDTGDFEGWVKVNRVSSSSGKKQAIIHFSNPNVIEYVNYCIEKGTMCKPTKSYFFTEGLKEVDVIQKISDKYVMCANYSYPDGDILKTSSTQCVSYADANNIDDNYRYDVILTLKDNNYAVENVVFNDQMSMKKFYDLIDIFYESHKDNDNPLAIAEPVCSATDSISYKGTTTTKTTYVNTSSISGTEEKETIIVTSSMGNNSQTTIVTTSSLPNRTDNIETVTTTKKEETTRGTIEVNPSTTTRNSQVVTTRITTSPLSEEDKSLLLSDINVNGYKLVPEFSPITGTYEITIPHNVSSLDMNVSMMDGSNSTMDVLGNDNLQSGTNHIVIKLTNNITGNQSRYLIIVKKLNESGQEVEKIINTEEEILESVESGLPDPTIQASDASLKTLRISGFPFIFRSDVYEYDIDIPIEMDKLAIDYYPTSNGAIAEMIGNKNLKDGSIISIKVVSENGYYTKEYKLNIHIEKKSKSYDKIIRSILIIVGVIIVIILIIIIFNKNNKKKALNDMETRTI